MNVGVSTACFYPEFTEVALEHILTEGVATGNVDVTEIFLNTYSETEKSYAQTLKKKIDESKIFVSSVHPFTSKYEQSLFFSDYDRRFYDGLEQYKMYYNFANEVGAKVVVLHGCMKHGFIENHDYFERFAKMREGAREYGIILAQENVAPYKSHSVDFIRDMKAYLNGEVEFVFDVKQAVRAKQNPLDMIDAMGKNIVHLHMSDNKLMIDRKGQEVHLDCLPIGEGSFDFYSMFAKLKDLGVDTTAVIELYRHNYSEYSKLYESAGRLKQIADTIYKGV